MMQAGATPRRSTEHSSSSEGIAFLLLLHVFAKGHSIPALETDNFFQARLNAIFDMADCLSCSRERERRPSSTPLYDCKVSLDVRSHLFLFC